MIVFGVHQLRKPVEWLKFIPPWMHKMSPMKPETEMRFHAVGNLLFGLFLIFNLGFPLVAVWIAFIWWLSIVPFAWRVDWALGMRDLTIAVSLLSLILILS